MRFPSPDIANALTRHCERSAAIHRRSSKDSSHGLPRYARSDEVWARSDEFTPLMQLPFPVIASEARQSKFFLNF